MSSKRSPAARVLDYFAAATLPEAEQLFGLIRDTIRKRRAAEDAPATKAPVRRRRKVNAKSQIADATAFPGVDAKAS